MTLQWTGTRAEGGKPIIIGSLLAMSPDCCCGGPCSCCSEDKIRGVRITTTDFCDTDTPLALPCPDDFSHYCACDLLNVFGLFIPADKTDGCTGIIVETGLQELNCDEVDNPNSRPEAFDRVTTYLIDCVDGDIQIAVSVSVYTSPWTAPGSILHTGGSGRYYLLVHNNGPCVGLGGDAIDVTGSGGAEPCNTLGCGPAPPQVCQNPCYDATLGDCPPPAMTIFIE